MKALATKQNIRATARSSLLPSVCATFFISLFKINLCIFAILLSSCGLKVTAKGTSDASIGFQGLKSFKARSDGTWLLEWERIPELQLTYEIFQREDAGQSVDVQPGSKFDFSKPVGKTTENFFITDVLIIRKSKCFVVRVKHPAYVDTNTKEFCTGTTPVTSSISKATAPPVFTQLSLANGATDGYLNAQEVLDDMPVVLLDGSGFDTAVYAVVPVNSKCEEQQSYSATLPRSGTVGKIDGSSNIICVKLANAFGESIFGASEPIFVDTTKPVVVTPSVLNLTSEGKLNLAVALAQLPLIEYEVGAGEKASYAVVESVSQCVAGLSYESSIPSTSHSGLLTGSSRLICVEVSDSAGNASYAASASFDIDTHAPLSPFVSGAVLTDSIVDIVENVAIGFPVDIKGEAAASFNLTCISNCIVVSGGTVDASGSSSTGELSSTGTAIVNVKAIASGTMTFKIVLIDSFGNTSSDTTTSLTAALTPPMPPTLSMTALSGSSVSILENATPMVVLVEGVANASYTLACIKNCEVKAGASGSLNSSGQGSPTIQVYADGDFEVSATIFDTVGNSSTGNLAGVADLIAPVVSIGSPSPTIVTSSGSAEFVITITGATMVNLTVEKVLLDSAEPDMTCAIAVSGSSLTSRTVTLSSCTVPGLVRIKLDESAATDFAGNPSAPTDYSGNLEVTVAAPVFVKLERVNGAADGIINDSEWSANLYVAALDASGFDTVGYAIIDATADAAADNAVCEDAATLYSDVLPKANAFPDESSKRVCVKLVNTVGIAVYGSSAVIDVDRTAPPLPTVDLSGVAADGVLSFTDRSLNGSVAVVSVTLGAGDIAKYAITTNASDCTNPLNTLIYNINIPTAGNAEFVHGTNKFICVRVNDVAGNLSDSASAAIATDVQPPVLSIGVPVPSKSVITNSDSLDFTITISGVEGDSVDLTGKILLTRTPAADVDCTVAVTNGTGTLDSSGALSPPPVVTLSSCTGSGTVSFKIAAGAATDAAANLSVLVGPSSVITVNNSLPNFVSFPLVNGATDGKINQNEFTANLVIGILNASGFETAEYALIDSTDTALPADINTACSNVSTYSAGVPLAGAFDFPDGSLKRVCVKLVNNAGVVGYGYSDLIEVDRTPPTLSSTPALTLVNGAVDSKINRTDVDDNLAVVDVLVGGTYSVAESSAQCTSALTYVSTPPTASDSGFANGTSRVVCLKLSDEAGNSVYGSSSAISIDHQNPLAPLLNVSALGDSFVNISENVVGGFSVIIYGELSTNFKLTCTINCTVVSGGTIAGDSLSSQGPLTSGEATVNIIATAGGAFTFNVESEDSFGNKSSATTQSGTADLSAPAINIVPPGSPPTVHSGQTVTYNLSFADTGAGISSVNLTSSDFSLSGDTVGCLLALNGSTLSSRTLTVTKCAAATGSVTVNVNIAAGKLVDSAGNGSEALSQSYSFSVSNLPPLLTITSPSNNSKRNNTSFNVQGICVTGLNVILASVDLSTPFMTTTCTSGTYSFSVTFDPAITDGSKLIMVTSQDLVGQVSSSSITVVKDTAPPTVSISAPNAMSTKQKPAPVAFTVSFSDSNGVSSVSSTPTITKVTTGGANCNVITPSIAGTGSYDVSVNQCTGNGSLSITVGAGASTDYAGNQSAATTATIALIVDNSAPTPSITSPTSGTFNENPVQTVLSGNCETGLPVYLGIGGDYGSEQTTTCVASSFSFSSWELTFGNGVKSVTVRQTDDAGNEGISAAQSYTLSLPPGDPTLNSSNATGLRHTVTGTCDSSATSHVVTTSVGRLASVVTCSGTALSFVLHLPPGSSDFSVTVTSMNAGGSSDSVTETFTRTAFTCPAGYVGVPRSSIGGLGNASAITNHANWWLDVSRDFCVMKYPAKKNNPTTPTYAVSEIDGLPWVSIARGTDHTTAGSAFKMCNDISGGNYRLISNTQWQTVARNAESVGANWSGGAAGTGSMARGHTDNSPGSALTNAADNASYYDTGNSSANAVGSGWEQSRTQTLSNGEVVWDFGGNVWQWVSDDYGDLGLSPSISAGWSEFSNTTNFPTSGGGINRGIFAPSGSYNSSHNIGRFYGGSGGAVMRGGYWNGTSDAGLFSALLSSPESASASDVGFRCVYLP